MFLGTTGTITCILTQYGKQLLADNSANFKITQYRFSDDEINYSDFDGSTVDALNTTILNTPILEASSFGKYSSQRYELLTLPQNILNLSYLDVDIGNPFVDGQQNTRERRSNTILLLDSEFWRSRTFIINVRTYYGYDTSYFSRSNNRSIVDIVNIKNNSIPNSDPYESRQNQSHGSFGISVNIQSNVDIRNTLTEKIIDDFSVLLFSQNENVEKSKLSLKKLLNSPAISNESVTISTSNQQQKIINTSSFDYLGLAVATIEIKGSNTGKTFYIDVIVYNKQRILQISEIKEEILIQI